MQLLRRLEEMYVEVVHSDPLPLTHPDSASTGVSGGVSGGGGVPRVAAGRQLVVREMELNPANRQRNPDR